MECLRDPMRRVVQLIVLGNHTLAEASLALKQPWLAGNARARESSAKTMLCIGLDHLAEHFAGRTPSTRLC
jgi:hypothetical protein